MKLIIGSSRRNANIFFIELLAGVNVGGRNRTFKFTILLKD
jgi:hypothetical protein